MVELSLTISWKLLRKIDNLMNVIPQDRRNLTPGSKCQHNNKLKCMTVKCTKNVIERRPQEYRFHCNLLISNAPEILFNVHAGIMLVEQQFENLKARKKNSGCFSVTHFCMNYVKIQNKSGLLTFMKVLEHLDVSSLKEKNLSYQG